MSEEPLAIIYTASKTKHAHKWRTLRDCGFNINSTWIDEAGAGESQSLTDLAVRCIKEAMDANYLILYREPEEIVKGAWIEVGAALASGTRVLAIGIDEPMRSAFCHHPSWSDFETLGDAVDFIRSEEGCL